MKTDTFRRTNERPGTRAHLRGLNVSAYKVREVLDLVRGQDVRKAAEILRFCERGPSEPVAKLLASAIANAVNNDEQDAAELFVSACFADEGTTMKRWRPRARGRASRIRKRSCHITIVVSRLPEDRLERLHDSRTAQVGARSRRVARSQQRDLGSTVVDEDQTTVAESPLLEEGQDMTPHSTLPIVEATEDTVAEPVVSEDIAPADVTDEGTASEEKEEA